jgi:hypothetical protein
MSIINDVISFFKFLFSIPGYVVTAWRFYIVKAAFDKAVATFPGVKNESALKSWADTNTGLLVQYAQWTPNKIDDYLTKSVQSIIHSKWIAIWNIIQLFVKSEKVEVIEDTMVALMEEVEDETGNPLVFLSIISLIVQILFLIYGQQNKKHGGITPTPLPRIRIFKRIRNRFNS